MSANGEPKYDDIESDSDSGESVNHNETGEGSEEKPLKSALKKSNPAIAEPTAQKPYLPPKPTPRTSMSLPSLP